MKNFLKRNILELKNRDSVFLKKKFAGIAGHYAYFLFFPVLSVLFFIMVLFSKLFKLQFATTDNGRIGGILNLYWYLSDLNNHKKERRLIVFFNPSSGKAANTQWDKMFKQRIAHFSSPLFYHYTQKLIKFYKGLGSNLIFKFHGNVFHNSKVINSIQQQKAPVLSLTKEECEYGEKLLEIHGIKKNEKVVCFHNRDSAYLNQVNPSLNWSYHDYRDSSIYNYTKAAETFFSKGYRPVRVGSIVLEKLGPEEQKFMVDYASGGWQSDFLDIYLAYRCSLFVCSDTGISAPPEIFHKPMVYANWTLLPRMTNWVHFAVFIPKKIFSKKLGRLLTFDEMITNADFINPHKAIAWEEFELTENTSDEILEACLEMEMRMNRTWTEDEESLRLQNLFWSKYPGEYVRPKRVYMGSAYLKQNQDLLR